MWHILALLSGLLIALSNSSLQDLAILNHDGMLWQRALALPGVKSPVGVPAACDFVCVPTQGYLISLFLGIWQGWRSLMLGPSF